MVKSNKWKYLRNSIELKRGDILIELELTVWRKTAEWSLT